MNKIKTQLTKDIEIYLINKTMKTSERYALEVSMCTGIVDFMTMSFNDDSMIPDIACYEIKISVSDFKSKHGHNLKGDYNYYVISEEVFNWLKKNDHYLLEEYAKTGVMMFKNGRMYKKKEHKRVHRVNKMNFEQKMHAVDSMLIKWSSGSMFRYLKEYGIELRNE